MRSRSATPPRKLCRQESGDPASPDRRRQRAAQKKQALVPQVYGRGAFGQYDLGPYTRVELAERAYCDHGWQLLRFGRHVPLPGVPPSASCLELCAHRLQLTLASEDAEGRAWLASFFVKRKEALPRLAPLVTPLAELQQVRPWESKKRQKQQQQDDEPGAPPVQYAPGLDRIGALLTLAHFKGALPALTKDAPGLDVQPGQSFRAALVLQDRCDFFDYLGTTKATLELRVFGTAERPAWRAVSNPDGALAAQGPAGGDAEHALLTSPAVLLYRLSAQQGTSVDAAPAVLEVLCAGVHLCACRTAHVARGLARSEAAAHARAGSAAPLLVLALQENWRRLEREGDTARTSRIWWFAWRDDQRGVNVRCSEPSTVSETLDRAMRHLAAPWSAP